ncbi:MAG: SWIM zinc finger family protein [Lachnospiraceae bacterium]|nr:SWIM zinc finger family protein [Lachnospiraceae bacterium]
MKWRNGDIYFHHIYWSVDYIVEIEVNGDRIRKMDCDCPYADGGNRCKHMAAVLYALEEKESGDAVVGPAYEHAKSGGQELQDVVNRMSEAVLRRLLIDLAEKNDSLRNQLMIQYAETISERQLLQFKRQML